MCIIIIKDLRIKDVLLIMNELIQQMSLFELGLNVTVIGIVIVFAMLIFLVGVLVVFGKTIQAVEGISAKRAEKKRKAMLEASAQDDESVETVEENTFVDNSSATDGELIAVISAAVSAMYAGSKKRPVIKSIRNSNKRRSAWANAGINDNTRAF